MTKLSPRQEAHACRIWGIAKACNWQITQRAIAIELGMDFRAVSEVIKLKGWSERLDPDARNESAHDGISRAWNRINRRMGNNFDENNLDLADMIGGGA
jgi:hypothetical protein